MQIKDGNSSRRGWVKLPKMILDWKHIKNINAVYLYAYLLLSADIEGNVKVSIRGLADMTGLSVRNVRTILSLLEREGMVTRGLTHEATQQLTQGTSIITICDLVDYDAAESDSRHSDRHSDRHTLQKGFPPTPPFLKNKQEYNNNINSACAKEIFVDEVYNCDYKQEIALKQLGMGPSDIGKFIALAKSIMEEWDLTGSDDWSWKHLLNHARIKLRNENGNQRNTNGNAADSGPDAFASYFAAKEFERRAKESAGHVS